MFDAGSPSEAAAGEWAAAGAVAFAFARRHGGTRIAGLRQQAPLRALFPKPAPADLPVAVIVNVGGGLVGGDRIEVRAGVGEGAAGLVTSQAAEKVYRSTGAECRVETRLEVGAHGWLEWCPQETILFEQARLRRSLRLEVAPTGRTMLGEILVFGRLAAGERTRRGLVHDRIEVRRDGALIWLDTLRLDGDYAPVFDARAGLDGAQALATFLYVAPDAAGWAEAARERLGHEEDGVRAGVTVVNGLLLLRWLASDPLALRRSFAQFWGGFRSAAAGLPPALPRLWQV